MFHLLTQTELFIHLFCHIDGALDRPYHQNHHPAGIYGLVSDQVDSHGGAIGVFLVGYDGGNYYFVCHVCRTHTNNDDFDISYGTGGTHSIHGDYPCNEPH
jgi:hypothetical protein